MTLCELAQTAGKLGARLFTLPSRCPYVRLAVKRLDAARVHIHAGRPNTALLLLQDVEAHIHYAECAASIDALRHAAKVEANRPIVGQHV